MGQSSPPLHYTEENHSLKTLIRIIDLEFIIITPRLNFKFPRNSLQPLSKVRANTQTMCSQMTNY